MSDYKGFKVMYVLNEWMNYDSVLIAKQNWFPFILKEYVYMLSVIVWEWSRYELK